MTFSDKIINDIPKGIISWYQFNKEDQILLIDDESVLKELFTDMLHAGMIAGFDYLALDDFCTSENDDCCVSKKYDVVFLSSIFEKAPDGKNVISIIKRRLKEHGKLLLAINNRFGIRYFCGDRDPYTDRSFDGVENYRNAKVSTDDTINGQMYDKARIEEMLKSEGFETRKYYSVFPTLEQPSLIFAENYLPNEELNIRIFPMYNSPETIFLEEEFLYGDLIQNGIFHKMANAFLVECYLSKQAICQDVLHVTMSLERGKQGALFTIIHENKVVEKKPVYREGQERIKELVQNNNALKNRGINVIEMQEKDGSCFMPFIEAETGLEYVKRLVNSDLKNIINFMDQFYEIIRKTSNIYMKKIDEDLEIEYFENGYLDMVPLNCFVQNDKLLFYDQEFCVSDCPVGVLVARLVDIIYGSCSDLEKIIPKLFFLERYHVSERINDYRKIAAEYLRNIRNEDELKLFHNRYRRNPETVHANRQRMNYSEEEYQRKFVDIFQDLGKRKLVLFGSGRFTKRFIAMYGKNYEIVAIVDNSESRWGQSLEGIEITSPAIFDELPRDSFKVLICIKNYLSVAKQLEKIGIMDYGIFDNSKSYAMQKTVLPMYYSQSQDESEDKKPSKKYKVGYVAGVFDMFHVGHINLLKKAKEQCEYLIVGVVSDNDVYRQKNKKPIISCEDRVEVLNSCKYVDRVEALPDGFGSIRDAYKMFHFDVQFSGDDHGNNPYWLADKEYLNKHGADLVFFDYTKKVSSTKLREQLKETK